jgi:UDP-N-acetylglucosamine enolpyruvyl transferase
MRGDDLAVTGAAPLVIQSDLGDAIPKVDDGPWPAFPADLMSVALVAATQAEGTVLFHEKMYESRLFFVDRLIGMGARVVLCDPHRALVHGPARLRGEPGASRARTFARASRSSSPRSAPTGAPSSGASSRSTAVTRTSRASSSPSAPGSPPP